MTPRYSVVTVHGINGASGKTQAGYSKKLAELVMPGMAWPHGFWREAVWEQACDDIDSEIKKVITELVNAYKLEEHIRNWLKTKKGCLKYLASLGMVFIPTFEESATNFISGILDYALDLPLYLGNAYGRRIRGIVEKTICQAAGQTGGVVVVGHSLGSVIARDVVAKLLEKPTHPNIVALVTMGSPLDWVDAVRKKAKVGPKIPPMPLSLKWVNYYNTVDPVPLKRELPSRNFPGVENVEIDVTTNKPLVAHSAYWENKQVVGQISRLVFPEGSGDDSGRQLCRGGRVRCGRRSPAPGRRTSG